MLQYSTINEADLGAGIDARSGENQIPEGYFTALLNADPVAKRLKKRKGFQQVGGYVPVRVNQIVYTDGVVDNIRFDLDSAIDLSNIPSTPIIVYGRTSVLNEDGDGRFPDDEDGVAYYASFTSNPRVAFDTGTNNLTLTSNVHNLTTSNIFVGTAESTSTTDYSNSGFIPNSIAVNQTSQDVVINYTNGAPSFQGFVYFSDKSAVAGETYVSGNTTVGAGVTSAISISAATHQLDNLNIIAKVFQDDGSSNIEVTPDSIVLNPSTGTIVTTVTNSSGSSVDIFVILTVAPVANIATGSVSGNDDVTVTISSFDGKFPFLGIYQELTVGGNLTQVIPDSVVYDAVDNNLEITFTNSSASSANFEIYYDYGTILTNQLYVTDSSISTAGFTDTAPQLTIWGLNHETLYSSNEAREGWVNHIDSYRRSLEERLVVGLGGNIYADKSYSEISEQYLLPQLYAGLTNRVDGDLVIGPTFYTTGDAPGRTRGYITSDYSGANWLSISEISYDENTGYTTYILSAPNLQAYDSAGASSTVGSVISTSDFLNVQNTEWAIFDGNFPIISVSGANGSDLLSIVVDNTNVAVEDFNTTNSIGSASIFSDTIPLVSDNIYLPNDIITSQLFDSTSLITISEVDNSEISIQSVVDVLTLPNGLRIRGTRTSSVIPMSDFSGTLTVENVVGGDTFTYPDFDRLLRTKYIVTQDDTAQAVVVDGEATIAFDNILTSQFSIGQNISLIQSPDLSGIFEITSIPTPTTITIDTDLADGTYNIDLQGDTVEVDESFEYTVDKAFTVASRFIPIEAPLDEFDLPKKTYVKHFGGDYTDQAFLRSTMVNDNMYFVNDNDEVMKFDGENVYRSGLPRWQPGVFVTLNNTEPNIVANNATSAVSSVNQNRFIITSGEEIKYSIDDRIRHDDDDQNYVITEVDDASQSIVVDRNISGTAGNITKLSTFRYYFRLNAIDANNNIIVSASTGSEDFRVDVAEDTAIELALIGMPAWDIYDYDRIEVEIFRTPKDVGNLPAFYKVATIPIGFNLDNGYIKYIDSTQDDELKNQLNLPSTAAVDPDFANTVNWSEPLRAQYITSNGNRLILGNVTGYPELDMTLYSPLTTVAVEDLYNTLWSFRRDNTTSGTISDTNNIDTIRYELVSGEGTEATAVLNVTADITLTDVIAEYFRNGTTFTLQVLPAAPNTLDEVLVTFTGTTSAIVCTVTPNNGTNNTATPVNMTTAQLVELINTGAIAAYAGAGAGTLVLTDASALRNNQTASGGGATVLVDGGEGDGVVATFSGGINDPVVISAITPSGDDVVVVTIGTHSLEIGDWVYIYNSTKDAANSISYAGWHQITAVAATTITINYLHNNAAETVDSLIFASNPTDVPVLLGIDGNRDTRSDSISQLLNPVSSMVKRLGEAINCTMRVCQEEGFTPWLMANYGGEYASGQILIRKPRIDDYIPEIEIPNLSGSIQPFINGLLRAPESFASMTEKLFPSRIIQSYPNFPELFLEPTSITDKSMQYGPIVNFQPTGPVVGMVRDVNSSDGQQITGIIPLFGESSTAASNGSQNEGLILTFKQNSVYVFNSENNNKPQKLDTEGKGCTAPYSITTSKDGIVFVNDSGIYSITHTLRFRYLGEKLERLFLEGINKDYLDLITSSNSPLDRKVRISYPVSGETSNSEVFSYDHTRETQDTPGAWSQYDNINATGWANLSSIPCYGSTGGRVFSQRATDTNTDYRQDDQSINMSVISRALDFGDSAARKAVISITSHFRTIVDSTTTMMYTATELSDQFTQTDGFVIDEQTNSTGLSDRFNQAITSLRASINRRKFLYLQVKYVNDTIDEPMEISGIGFRVALLSNRGTVENADS